MLKRCKFEKWHTVTDLNCFVVFHASCWQIPFASARLFSLLYHEDLILLIYEYTASDVGHGLPNTGNKVFKRFVCNQHKHKIYYTLLLLPQIH